MVTRRTLLRSSAAILPAFGIMGGVSAAGQAVGTVVGLRGDCTMTDPVSKQRQILTLGSRIELQSIVEVPQGAKLKIRMDDGSFISLSETTQLVIPLYYITPSGRKAVSISLIQGLLRALVSIGQPGVFEVITAIGSSVARSTDWFVEKNSSTNTEWMKVVVLDGIVEIGERSRDAFRLSNPIMEPLGSVSAGAGVIITPPRVTTTPREDRLAMPSLPPRRPTVSYLGADDLNQFIAAASASTELQ